MSHSNSRGNYAPVNGLQMYYEIHGEGRPLVLLHGALSAIGTSFGKLLPSLAQTRQVIAIEQQAHGHTADIDRPLSIAHMADDTAALLAHLGIDNADFLGYSLGAGIALEIAVRYPKLVHKLVLASVGYNKAGFIPGVLDGIDQIKAEDMIGTPWQAEYASIAPRPADWSTLVEKIKYLDMHIPDWPAEAIRAISVPVLLMIGDGDIIRPEHAVEMFRLLGKDSQLAILPGTSHIEVMERADLLLNMIPSFLDAPVSSVSEAQPVQ